MKLKSLFQCFGTLFIAVLALGCESGGEFTEPSGMQGGGNPFVGTFLGANNVAARQVAALNFTVGFGGNATGTLQVGAVMPQAVNVAVGTYQVTGTVDRATGAFTLNGNIPPIGVFTIRGNIATGTYTFTFNGQTFQGAVQSASLGAPSVPTGNNNGGGNQSQLIAGGSLSNFVFNPDGNYNGTNPPVTANPQVSGAVGPGQNGESAATIVLSETQINGTTAEITTLAFTVVDPSGNPIQAGNTYQLATGSPPSGAAIALSKSVGTSVQEGYSLVAGTTGTIEIISVDANSITMDFNFTNVGPNTAINGNPSLGTFATSGRLIGNFATTP